MDGDVLTGLKVNGFDRSAFNIPSPMPEKKRVFGALKLNSSF